MIKCTNKAEALKMIQSYHDFVKPEDKIKERKILKQDDLLTYIAYITNVNDEILSCT